MKGKLVVLLLLFLSLSTQVLGFQTKAKAAILIDYESGQLLFEKNPHERVSPSSMIKMMTTYVAFYHLKQKHIKLEDVVTVSGKARNTEGSRMFLEQGSKVSFHDLLLGISVQSGNDAAICIAEGISGDIAVFVEQMNVFAKRLNLKNTHFDDPTGLPSEGNYSTVYDLALLARSLISDFPEYYHYFSEKTYTFNNITQGNRNVLLGRRGVDGIKTGFSSEVGYSICVSALTSDKRLIAVLTGLNSKRERVLAVELMLSYGINNFKYKVIFNKDDKITTIPVLYGEDEGLDVLAQEDIKVLLYNIEKIVDVKVKHDKYLIAPIKKSSVVGELQIELPEKSIMKVLIYSNKDIEEVGIFGRVWQNLKLYIKHWS